MLVYSDRFALLIHVGGLCSNCLSLRIETEWRLGLERLQGRTGVLTLRNPTLCRLDRLPFIDIRVMVHRHKVWVLIALSLGTLLPDHRVKHLHVGLID